MNLLNKRTNDLYNEIKLNIDSGKLNTVEEVAEEIFKGADSRCLVFGKDHSKDAKDAYLYRLRKNDILNWVDRLSNVNKYRDILKECNLFSTLKVESGIVRIDPSGNYISHTFLPYIKAGFNFNEISIIMKAEIISFEEEYGKILLSTIDLESLKNIVYKYNRETFSKLDVSDKKKLIHLEQTAMVLSCLLVPSIILTTQINGWCTLNFTNDGNSSKDYCTIFTEEELLLLEKINKSIQK